MTATPDSKKIKEGGQGKALLRRPLPRRPDLEHMLNTGGQWPSPASRPRLGRDHQASPEVPAKVLFQSDRFAMEDRRWNLALRLATHLTFEGSIEFTLRSYGRPSRCRPPERDGDDPSPHGGLLRAPARRDAGDPPQVLGDAGRQVGAGGMDSGHHGKGPQSNFLRNFFLEAQEVRPLVDSCWIAGMSPEQPAVDMAVKLIRKMDEPLPLKPLTYPLWCCGRQVRSPRVLPGDSGRPAPADLLRRAAGAGGMGRAVLRGAGRASKRAEKEEDFEWAEEEEPEGPVVILPARRRGGLQAPEEAQEPQTAARALVESVFEYGPTSRRFQETVEQLSAGGLRPGRPLPAGRAARPGHCPT